MCLRLEGRVCLLIVLTGRMSNAELGVQVGTRMGMPWAVLRLARAARYDLMQSLAQDPSDALLTKHPSLHVRLQGMILLITGPFVDKLASGKWLMEWEVGSRRIQCVLGGRLGAGVLTGRSDDTVSQGASPWQQTSRYSRAAAQALPVAGVSAWRVFGGMRIAHTPVSSSVPLTMLSTPGPQACVPGMLGGGTVQSCPFHTLPLLIP